MQKSDAKLVTPIYLKTEPNPELPADPIAYVLSSSGLYLCRNHRFFQSCVPAPRWPRELRPHSASLRLNYPKIPRAQFELVVGFFAKVAKRYSAEAAVLLLFDQKTDKIRFFIPKQEATVSRGWAGKHYPVDLKYDLPTSLDPTVSLIGDIHSHADEAAYASYKDKLDEVHQAGVHIVVGRIHQEPPELHCEFVVDGYRFMISPKTVLGGYQRRRQEVPQAWLDRVEIRVLKYQSTSKNGQTKNWNNQNNYQNAGYEVSSSYSPGGYGSAPYGDSTRAGGSLPAGGVIPAGDASVRDRCQGDAGDTEEES